MRRFEVCNACGSEIQGTGEKCIICGENLLEGNTSIKFGVNRNRMCVPVDISRGREWRKKWSKLIEDKRMKLTIFNIVIMWLTSLSLFFLIVFEEKMFERNLGFFIISTMILILVLLMISISILITTKNKNVIERVLLQQSEDIRFMSKHIDIICSRTTTTEENKIDEILIFCPHCNSKIYPEKKYCSNCGEDVSNITFNCKCSTKYYLEETGVPCDECGEWCFGYAKYCQNCGKRTFFSE